MYKRMSFVPLNYDKYPFLMPLLLSILLLVFVMLVIRLFRLQGKIRTLVEKLKAMDVVHSAQQKGNQKEEIPGNKVRDKLLLIPARENGREKQGKEPVYVLTSQQAGFLIKRIRIYMQTEKPYLDPKFNMNKLCDALGINRTYLSSAINQKTGHRFETFINAYRISDAVDLLAAEESSQYTLEYLATKVGFQSKSTFNRSFKQFTGINPSFFQRIILQDKAARKFFFDYFEDLKNSNFSLKAEK